MKKLICALVCLTSITLTTDAQIKWNIDRNHSNIRFTAIHYMISEVDGEFKSFEGSVIASSEDFDEADVAFTAQVASIDTDNERRDNHLKSDDFFNAETFPEINFKGKLEKDGDQYFLTGDLTMRDVTKPVQFDVRYIGSVSLDRGRKAGFKVTGEVNRFDYGIKFNRMLDSGGLVVSKEIGITCNIELNEAKE